MKTINSIWDSFISMDNIRLAHRRAKKGKSSYKSVQDVEHNLEPLLKNLQWVLKNGKFSTSDYTISTIVCGGKERVLHKLPYYPDRIVHHMLMNIVSEHWKRTLIRDTFQSIKGRGTSDCIRRVRSAVLVDQPKFGIKLDINKYYPSLKNNVTCETKQYKIKDIKILEILLDILRSLEFIPLGNHTSQYVGNIAISDVDWFAKQGLKIRHYYRYCDDIVILGNNKQEMYSQVQAVSEKLAYKDLSLKNNEQLIDLSTQPLDFVGARFTHNRILLRKSIEEKFKESMKQRNLPSVPSYYGWCKQVGAYNLYNKHYPR